MPWKYSISEEYLLYTLSEEEEFSINAGEVGVEEKDQTIVFVTKLGKFKLAFALFFAIIGQFFLQPPDRNVPVAIAFFVLSLGLVTWVAFLKDPIFEYPDNIETKPLDIDLSSRKQYYLAASGILFILAFFAFQKNSANEVLFNFLNLSLWSLSLIFFLLAFLDFKWFDNFLNKCKQIYYKKHISIKITPWMILLIVASILAIYFRFYRLNEVLGEMFSDHGNVFLKMGDFYVSLMDIHLKGNIQGDSLFNTNVYTVYDGTNAGKSVLVQEINSSMQIQRMSIDSIRIGTEPGVGKSMGSVFIDNMRVNQVGTIQVK